MIKKNTTAESLPNTETLAVKYNLKQERLVDEAMAADSLCAFDNLTEENKTERQKELKRLFLNYQKEFRGFFAKADFSKLRNENVKNAIANLNKNKKRYKHTAKQQNIYTVKNKPKTAYAYKELKDKTKIAPKMPQNEKKYTT